jgi:hypothetical protein
MHHWNSNSLTLADNPAEVHYEAFIELNDRATEAFYADAPIRRWHGYRVRF